MNQDFWEFIQALVHENHIIIDRPKGSRHPRLTSKVYPTDYGYLEGTSTLDQGGVDIWIGTLGLAKITAILCTVDLFKKDTELKILYDCTPSEICAIEEFANTDQMRALAIKRDEDKR
jgi:inorganic pyrophosphatase